MEGCVGGGGLEGKGQKGQKEGIQVPGQQGRRAMQDLLPLKANSGFNGRERRAVPSLGDHLHFLQLLKMKKTRAISSRVSRTPEKKAKTKYCLLFWQRKGADGLLSIIKAFPTDRSVTSPSWGSTPQGAFLLASYLSHSPGGSQLSAFRFQICLWSQ